jgi:hypothetical protein
MGADESGCAEVVYTTLPVLVEMIVRCLRGMPICRSFGPEFRRSRQKSRLWQAQSIAGQQGNRYGR